MSAPPDPRDLPAGSPANAIERLSALSDLLDADDSAPSSVRGAREVRQVHIADSLSGLAAAPLQAATDAGSARPAGAADKAGRQQAAAGVFRIGDLGAGAGLPGLVLAIVLPGAHVDLIEATSRKCEFIARAVAVVAADNASVVCERAETWAVEPAPAGGREGYDVITARAVGRLAMLAELASPLLRVGGSLVAWKGRRDRDEEAELERAGDQLAMRISEVIAVTPYSGSRRRHIYVVEKAGPTPAALPRRPGMAKKRPFGHA